MDAGGLHWTGVGFALVRRLMRKMMNRKHVWWKMLGVAAFAMALVWLGAAVREPMAVAVLSLTSGIIVLTVQNIWFRRKLQRANP